MEHTLVYSPASLAKACQGGFSIIRSSNELSNLPPAFTGLRDLPIVLLPYGFDHLLRGSGYGPLSQTSSSVSVARWYYAHTEITNTDG